MAPPFFLRQLQFLRDDLALTGLAWECRQRRRSAMTINEGRDAVLQTLDVEIMELRKWILLEYLNSPRLHEDLCTLYDAVRHLVNDLVIKKPDRNNNNNVMWLLRVLDRGNEPRLEDAFDRLDVLSGELFSRIRLCRDRTYLDYATL